MHMFTVSLPWHCCDLDCSRLASHSVQPVYIRLPSLPVYRRPRGIILSVCLFPPERHVNHNLTIKPQQHPLHDPNNAAVPTIRSIICTNTLPTNPAVTTGAKICKNSTGFLGFTSVLI